MNEKLLMAAGALPENVHRWLQPLIEATTKYDILAPGRLAAFLAQVGHESNSFRSTSENLNYSKDGLLKTFPKYFPTQELATEYARQPEKIADHVYASRLGNGDEESGDGWKFRGRGLIQLTGKKNVESFSMAYFGDARLVDEPGPLEEPELAAMSAGWFWFTHGLNTLADAGQFEAITRKINGGLIGQDDRVRRWERIKEALSQG